MSTKELTPAEYQQALVAQNELKRLRDTYELKYVDMMRICDVKRGTVDSWFRTIKPNNKFRTIRENYLKMLRIAAGEEKAPPLHIDS